MTRGKKWWLAAVALVVVVLLYETATHRRELADWATLYYVDWWQPKVELGPPEACRMDLPRVIAHAGGGVNKEAYTNTLEALVQSERWGFSCAEVDLCWSSDGQLVLLHDWNETVRGRLGIDPPRVLSATEFTQVKARDGLTQLTFDDFAQWLRAHPKFRVVLHPKLNPVAMLSRVKQDHPDLLPQLLSHYNEFTEYKELRALGFQHLILALTRHVTPDALVSFASRYPQTFILISDNQAKTDLPRVLKQAGIDSYAHTVNDEAEKARVLANGATGIYTDFLPPDETLGCTAGGHK